mgnify:FL=1
MKIVQLDLLAFGPFTEQSLLLDGGQYGLHIIYGPNEAGKSSSLRALRQWLYGIPHNSRDNFVHNNPNLRVGGVLEAADGTRLECVRRKGRDKTLRDRVHDQPIDEVELQRLLGGVDETVFAQRFGIDYEELRRGGAAVVSGHGDLGAILFAAGAGIADVRRIQAVIENDMAELFKPRGSTPRINEAVSRLKEARSQIKSNQLATADWVRYDQALREARQREVEISEQLHEKRPLKHKFERIAKALPLNVRRRSLERELVAVVDTPRLPEDFSGLRIQSVTKLSNAQKSMRDAAGAIQRLEETIAQLDIPQGLLEHRTAITHLQTELGSYQKAARDRPGLDARLQEIEQQAKQILQELGREPELMQSESLRLSQAQRRRIRSLAEDYKARVNRQQTAGQAVRQLLDEIETIESQLAQLPDHRDVGELKRATRRAERRGNLDDQLANERAVVRDLERQVAVSLDRLPLWSGSLEELESLPVPIAETVDRFENDTQDAAQTLRQIELQIDDSNRQLQQCDQDLEQLRLERDVPTEENLSYARQHRDEGWQLVWQVWQHGLGEDAEAVAEFIKDFAPGSDLAAAYRASVVAVDATADRLRREAERVARKAQLSATRRELEQRRDRQIECLAAAQQRFNELNAEWARLWSPLGITPLSPREMRAWLRQQQDLAATAHSLRQHRDSVSTTDALASSLQEDLVRHLNDIGASSPDSDSLSAAIEHCESVIHEIDEVNRQRTDTEQRLQSLTNELPARERHVEQANVDVQQWRDDWADAVAALGLNEKSSTSEATAVIEQVDELFGLVREAGELQNRIDGIDRDAAAFEQSVKDLFEQVDRKLLDLPPPRAISDLSDRLRAATEAQTKRESLQEQLATEKLELAAAESAIKQWEADIAQLCELAGCTTSDELSVIERQAAARTELEEKLRNVNEQLEGLAAGGASLNEFVAEAESFDPDQLLADLQKLDDEIERLDAERIDAAKSVRECEVELKRMDGSGRAAEAQELAESLLAGIRSDADQYVRLRLASVLLRRTIDRYREANRAPVLSLASNLFADLTLGSFAELRADFDEKGSAVLVGVRNSGQVVGVDGMSEGTRDQLYLALRLALLEVYLTGHEPMPFIVDDLLIMFDDDRAVAALKALARLASKTQVLFFTHHEHLVELARDKLDKRILFSHSLTSVAAMTKG